MENIVKALCKVDEFCDINKIEYTVTGTVALRLLGVAPQYTPQSIDIKVHHLTPAQADKLLELQYLSGINNSDKPSNHFTFMVNGIEVNAVIDKTEDYDAILKNQVQILMLDEESIKHRNIGVQLACCAMEDKMALNRPKDHLFLLDLIHYLTSCIYFSTNTNE